MLADTNSCSEDNKVFQSYAATQPRLTGYDAMAANNNVVGDLNKVVDLGSLSNDRIANPSPIDCRSSSNLDIMLDYDSTELRHLEVSSCAHYETEPVLTDMATRMYNDSVANHCIRD